MDKAKPIVRLKRSTPKAKCRRELRLSRAGIPVLCGREAVFQIGGVDLCQEHVQEAMRGAETRQPSE